MAEKLVPQRVVLSEINNGNQYNLSDGVQANAINDPIQASAYAQELAVNLPNIDEIDGDGEPYVGIEEVELNDRGYKTPRLVFKNLKGKKGEDAPSVTRIDALESRVSILEDGNQTRDENISKLQKSQDALQNTTNRLDNMALAQSYMADELKKRVANLEQGLPSKRFVTDDTNAYKKVVPANVSPYAMISKLGGYSKKNLILPTKKSTDAGITVSPKEDGSILVTGTNIGTRISYCWFKDKAVLPIGEYTLSGIPSSTTSIGGGNRNSDYWMLVRTFGTENDASAIRETFAGNPSVDDVITFSVDEYVTSVSFCFAVAQSYPRDFDLTLYPMLVRGTKKSEWFGEVRSAAVNKISLASANLIPYNHNTKSYPAFSLGVDRTDKGITYTLLEDGKIKAIGTSTASSYVPFCGANNAVHLGGTYYVSNLPSNTSFQARRSDGETNISCRQSNPVLELPEDNYSLRLFVDANRSINETVGITLNKVSPDLPFSLYHDPKTVFTIHNGGLVVYGQGNPLNENEYNYIDFDEMKYYQVGELVNGVWTTFETPIVTSLDYLFLDNYFEVEQGGTLVFENENQLAVPSEVTFQLKEGSV